MVTAVSDFCTDAPLNVTIEVNHNGSLAEGRSVNLTCSSAANPPAVIHTWYRRTASSSILQVGSGQVLSLPSLELSNTGIYICQARNRLGENNSTEVLLEVDKSESEYARQTETKREWGSHDEGQMQRCGETEKWDKMRVMSEMCQDKIRNHIYLYMIRT